MTPRDVEPCNVWPVYDNYRPSKKLNGIKNLPSLVRVTGGERPEIALELQCHVPQCVFI